MSTNGSSNAPPNPPSQMTTNGNKPPPGGGRSSTSKNNFASGQPMAAAAPATNGPAAKQRHQHKNGPGADILNHAVALSGGAPADGDAAYCAEVARRSAARAALHLGAEGMEGAALDVLGSALLGYMDQVGTTISSNVEASRRSSAHANAYDALNSVERCTAPAAAQMGSAATTSAPQTMTGQNGMDEAKERGWEGLASFLFGPNWFSLPLEGDAAVVASGKEASAAGEGKGNLQNGTAHKAPGGKALLPQRPTESPPKGKQLSTMKERSVSFSLERQRSVGGEGTDAAVPADEPGAPKDAGVDGRWHAPYLSVVPEFPLVTSSEGVANPHRLSGKVSLSLHGLATEAEACRDPPGAKRQRRGSGGDSDGAKLSVVEMALRRREQAADRAMRAALRIPDDVYSTKGTVWGSMKDEATGAGADGDKKPSGEGKAGAASKVKFDPAAKQPPVPSSGLELSGSSVPRPSYVPNFLPPFPTDEDSDLASEKLAAAASTTAVMGDMLSRMHSREKRKDPPLTDGEKDAVSERDSVRRSVIGLGKPLGTSYWGSLDDEDSSGGKGNAATKPDLSGVTVAPGERGSGASAAKKSGPDASQVVPLGRASGSRLSKILEGSMAG